MDDITTMILAAGGLGTAAFGIVEALKWTSLGLIGFGTISKLLGPLYQVLSVAYGKEFEKLLQAYYKGEQRELARTIRQGIRVGLTSDNAGAMADFLGVVSGDELSQAARYTQTGEELPVPLRNVLGRFELAVDARIEAALTLAQNHYVGGTRVAAAVVALVIALIVGLVLSLQAADFYKLFQAILIGVVAVPIAPVAKDLVTAIQSVSSAIGARR